MEYIQKEKDSGEGPLRDGAVRSRGDAVKSLREDIALLQQPSHVTDHLSQIAQVRSSIEANRQSITYDEARQGHANCAALLLELRENLSTATGALDRRYSGLLAEIKEGRRAVTLLLSNDRSNRNQHHLPQSLSKAFKSLRAMLPNSDEDDGETDLVALLEHELTLDLIDARNAYDYALARRASGNTTRAPCWDEKSQIIFSKIVASGHGNPSAKRLCERLKRELPCKTEQDIL